MECNGPQCSINNTQYGSSCECAKCDCPSCTGQNPVDFIEMTWHKAAMAAIVEAKKDRIKARIEEKMSSALDQGADAVIEHMHKKISSAVATAGGEQELRAKLVSILREAC